MNVTFTVPESAEILVKVNQKIDFGTPFLKQKGKEEVRVPIASLLHIQPNKIFNYLTKFVGDAVKKGDLIARNKTFLINRQYFSEYNGMIKEINHTEGVLVLQVSTDEKAETTSSMKGEIVSIEGKEIKVKVQKGKEYEIKEANEPFGGETLFFEPKFSQLLTTDDVSGRVVIASRLQPYDQIKLETLGAKGFITMHSLPEQATIPTAKISKSIEWTDFTGDPYSYCTIDTDSNKIYFYN
ncbi:MAG: hypothetical protein RI947_179 [Candidatus Parcubacteria bacterium]|jgi:hypothetical protein